MQKILFFNQITFILSVGKRSVEGYKNGVKCFESSFTRATPPEEIIEILKNVKA